jgi:hypothetical protein
MRIALPLAAASLVLAGSALAAVKGAVLFADNFSHAKKTWHPGKYNFGTVSYHQGKLRMALLSGGYTWDLPTVSWDPVTDMTVQADTRFVSGARSNNMGVICAVDPKNRYDVVVGGGGLYGVARVNNGKSTTVLKKGYDKATVHATQVNHLLAHCTSGGTIELTVNGKQLFSITDEQPLGAFTRAGLKALDKDTKKGATIDFDNFKAGSN